MAISINAMVRQLSRRWPGKLFIYFCLLSINLTFAVPPTPTTPCCQSVTYENNAPVTSGTATLTSSNLGIPGPFSFGVGYGSLDEFNINAQYTTLLGEDYALSGLVEYGPEMYRLGVTFGFTVLKQGLAKISAERFSQELPFSFDSGDINENVAQNAIGARYQHAFAHAVLRNLNGGVYYAHAPNLSLDPIAFAMGDLTAINYRNIAGGTSKGFDLGTDFRLTDFTELSAQIYYDHLHYNTEYTDDSEFDAQGFGGGLGIKQLLTDRVAVSAVGTLREIYNTYTLGISWLPPALSGLEVSLLGQRIASQNTTPSNNTVGLQFGYDFGAGGGGARYSLAAVNSTTDLEQWTGTPAVYMDQVLAISDERTVLVEPEEDPATKLLIIEEELAAPAITAISPPSGALNGGTSVVITGTDFTGTTAVKFGTTNATNFTVNSNTQITATAPTHTAGIVHITVTNATGISPITTADQFTYQAAPTVTAITPIAGSTSGGTVVTLTGSNFIGASAVNFGPLPASSFTVNSATSITAISPPNTTGAVNITVTTPSGSSAAAFGNQFTYGPPTISSISPKQGAATGATLVTLTGTNFVAGATVSFGGTPGTSVTVLSPTQITVRSPAGVIGNTVDITVTTLGGTSETTPAAQFTYLGPVVTGVTPSIGSALGGASVTLTGSSFTGTTGIKFGTTAAASFSLINDTNLTVTAPAHAAGLVDIRVTTPNGTSVITSADQFTYQARPTVTAITPKAGPIAGGTSVTLTGTDFSDVSAVQFGGTNANSFTVQTPTSIIASTPPNAAGAVNATVTTIGGTSAATGTNQFTYNAPPTISKITPAEGASVGNTPVTLTGTNFAAGASVSFGGKPGTSVTMVSPEEITVRSPAGTIGTKAHITVTTPGGTSPITSADEFTYLGPVINSVTPNIGSTAGGTPITLTGSGFTGTTSVKLGTTTAANFTVVDDSTITVSTPARGASVVNAIVTTPNGISVTATANQYTYQAPPTITQLAPNAGPLTGGPTVTLTGTNFIGVTAVKFGANAAVSFTVNSATSITATIPANVAGVVNATVTTPVGTSAAASGNQFTYNAAPTVTSITPAQGASVGNTPVTITGTNFVAGATVSFGGLPATSVAVLSPTQISARSPAAPPGTVADITVTTSGGTSSITSAAQFTYQGPRVTSVTPNAGKPTDNTSVALQGTNFTGATAVRFGTKNAVSFSVINATTINAIAPANISGTVNVEVATPLGVSAASSASQFTYEEPPTITSISPRAGVPTGDTPVVITGTNFTAASQVTFGTAPATNMSVISPTEITVKSPSGTLGSRVNVAVTTPVGTTPATAASAFIYENSPTVTNVQPNAGLPAGGTTVSISGENLQGVIAVYFGSTPAASFTGNTDKVITAVSPAGSLGSDVHITVVTDLGSSPTTLADQFFYVDYPVVTSISPNAGEPAGDTPVTIEGNHFTNNSSVHFGTTPATRVTVHSNIKITALSPPGSLGKIANVAVTTPVGTSPFSANSEFVYEVLPSVNSVSPDAGLPTGNTTVLITGTNFLHANEVYFGTTPATSFIVDSDTQITAETPAGVLESTVNVTVVSPLGISPTTPADHFTYMNLPTITALSPNAGEPVGGTNVKIIGTNFPSNSQVTFGATDATHIQVIDSTQILAVSPASVAGTQVNVAVHTPVGISAFSPASQFTFASLPTVNEVDPIAGLPTGGKMVLITGTGFSADAQVHFGNTPATNVWVNTPTQITAEAPSGTVGTTVDITVTTALGPSPSSPAAHFTYANPPTVTSVSPNAGEPKGGTDVIIIGSDFTNESKVTFGSTPAQQVKLIDSTKITAQAPPGVLGQKVNVAVTTPVGSSPLSADSEFIYENLPTVISIEPTGGISSGGTTVLITGTNFSPDAVVKFGTLPATNVRVNNAQQITVDTPAGTVDETVNVTVTTVLGTSPISSTDRFTYADEPTVIHIEPNAGLPEGETPVTIEGTHFTPDSTVTFGTQAAARYDVISNTQIKAYSPPGTLGEKVNVAVTTPIGTSPVAADSQFTYETLPLIQHVSPNAGEPGGGTIVLLKGTNFTKDAIVKFGTVPAQVTFNNAQELTVTAPSGTLEETVDITVTTPLGTSPISSADEFTYMEAPQVISLQPNSGVPVGGTPITLSGKNFTQDSQVTFGSTPAVNIKVPSSTQITAFSPPGIAGEKVNVAVSTPLGTSPVSADSEFTYQDLPTVTGVTPNADLPMGGANISISGTYFSPDAVVKFGTVTATDVIFNSSTQLTAVAPPGTVGDTVHITVTTELGPSLVSEADQFTYAEQPTIISVEPNSGAPAGDTMITIIGTDFTKNSTVTFGTLPATRVVVDSDTQITAFSPAGTLGKTVNVAVTTPVGTSPVSADSAFVYAVLPAVLKVAPNAGVAAGGSTILITGNNFSPDARVKFGSVEATQVIFNNSEQLTVVTPPGMLDETVDITVTTALGTSPLSPASQFTYADHPTIVNIQPNAGPPAGDTPVIINGTNFTANSEVTFGTTPATDVTVLGATQISAKTPPGIASVNVTVTTPVSTSAVSAGSEFIYEELPTISSIWPNAGVPSGGTAISIKGSNFSAGAIVKFGNTVATELIVNSPTEITAIIPNGTLGETVDVTVTTPLGTSPLSPLNKFTYAMAPTISNITPNSGKPTGGTSVIITGTHFITATAVRFGATQADFVIDSDTQITAFSPAGNGSVHITVTNPISTSSVNPQAQFTYADIPHISALSPNSGVPSGGTSVVITGNHFANTIQVQFGTNDAQDFLILSPTQLLVTAPPGSGTVDVTVRTPVGVSLVAVGNQFTYEGPPVITQVTPNAGLPAGGTSVVITGTEFTDVSTVLFGAKPATYFTVDNDTQITAVSPPYTSGTTVHITATSPIGTSTITPADQFTYEGAPTIESIYPIAGMPEGGTPMVINGMNFTSATAVKIGDVYADNISVISSTQIMLTTPAGSADTTVDVVVENAIGASLTTSQSQYTYEYPPIVSDLSPNFAAPTGYIPVVITGSHFTHVTAVYFGNTRAINFTIDSPTQITAMAPNGTLGKVNVSVTNLSGTSTNSADNVFSYVYFESDNDDPHLSATRSMNTPISAAMKLWTPIIFTPAFRPTVLTLAANSPLLTVGQSTSITAIGIAENAAEENLTQAVIWQSSDPQVATVDAEGIVSAKKPGITTISATYQGILTTLIVEILP